MKRLIIVCEGPTEQEFCKNIIAPMLLKQAIVVEAPTVKHSNGGIVAWETLKRQIEGHLKEKGAIVSMLIDYYGIKDSYQYPGWEASKAIDDKQQRMHFLFEQMKNGFPENVRYRFIPYIQLHEYESLLFSDISVFEKTYGKKCVDEGLLQNALKQFHQPEMINNGPSTAPSKRIEHAVPSYEKVLDGSYLAMEIGLKTMREKCKLFDAWIGTLEKGGEGNDV